MARASALQAGGRGFEPHILHESRTEFLRGSLTGWETEKADTKTDTHWRRGRAVTRCPGAEREREAS